MELVIIFLILSYLLLFSFSIYHIYYNLKLRRHIKVKYLNMVLLIPIIGSMYYFLKNNKNNVKP